jgi:hypothetical protein
MGTIISYGGSTGNKAIILTSASDFTAATGDTGINSTGSFLVPASTVNIAKSVVELTARAIKTGTTGTLTVRIYVNAVDTLSGATLLATTPAAASALVYNQLQRTMFVSKNGTKVIQAGGGLYFDVTAFSGAQSNIAIDWDIDQYIIMTVQNSASGDSSIGSGIIFKIFK